LNSFPLNKPEATGAGSTVSSGSEPEGGGASPCVREGGARANAVSWGLGLLLFAAVIFAYQPAWNAGFIWDDDDYVTHNPLLTAPDGLQRIWFSTDSPSQYFPLTYTNFRLQHAIWGLNASGYHWVNILLHAANALLVWRLLTRLAIPGAWLAAGIFALHPVQVESVAWITELKNVQSLFFFLLALLAWTEFVDKRRGWGAYAAALGFYALALFSKTTACTLPAALVLILWLKHKPITRARVMQVVPFAVLGLAMGLLTVWWERHQQGTDGSEFSLGALERLLIATRAVWLYLGKLIWPAGLAFSYPLWTIDTADAGSYVWLVAGLCLAGAIFIGRRIFGRSVETAAVFFVAMLSPLLGFFMLYTFRYSYVADHYQYVAMLGPVALAAAGLTRAIDVFGNWARFARISLGVVLLGTLGVLTWRQSRMYKDVETLWRATIERNPTSFIAHNNLSSALLEKGRVDEALANVEKALSLQPKGPDLALAQINLGNARLQKGELPAAIAAYEKAVAAQENFPDAHNNLGSALQQAGDTDAAIARFRRALALQPDHANAHYNLGGALLGRGVLDEAVSHLQTAVSLRPDDAAAHNDLGTALLMKDRPDDAAAHFAKAVKLQPDLAQAHNNLGFISLRAGRAREAFQHFETVLRLQPDNARTLSHFAWVLSTWPDAAVRDGARAILLAQRAREISGATDPVALYALAAALAESGRFPEAVSTAERAMQLADEQFNSGLAGAIRAHLELYRAGSPVRDPAR
jgi:protein O-mannosyl-transferase